MQQPGVREARWWCATDEDGRRRRLVAYLAVEPGISLGAAELRAHLAARLPDYMVPSAFVILDGLPLTAQRQGRPPRAAGAGGRAPRGLGAAAPPRGPLEETLAALFCEVLGLDASACTTASSSWAGTRCWP